MNKTYIKTIYKTPSSNPFWQEVGTDAKSKEEIAEPALPSSSKEEAEILEKFIRETDFWNIKSFANIGQICFDGESGDIFTAEFKKNQLCFAPDCFSKGKSFINYEGGELYLTSNSNDEAGKLVEAKDYNGLQQFLDKLQEFPIIADKFRTIEFLLSSDVEIGAILMR